MSQESEFKGLYVDEFLEIPTKNIGSTVKFRVNLETSQLEFYHKDKKRWIANSFIDLSFENGLAEILAVDDNCLYDTDKFHGIENSMDLLLGLKHTWTGYGGKNVTSSIKKLPYQDAISNWDIPQIDKTFSDNGSYMLKIDIKNDSDENYYFLQQNNFNITGPHQVRSFIYVKNANKSYLTNEYELLAMDNKWEYITLRNEKWNPHIKPKGEITFYLFHPYFSTGWHGDYKVIWKDEQRVFSSSNNLHLTKSGSNCIVSDTLNNILEKGFDLKGEYIIPIKNKFIDDLYKWAILTIEKFHVNNFIHHDLLLNRFEEAIQYDNDRNVNINLEKKYPFMLHFAKEYNHSFINLSTQIKYEMCRYRNILRNVFLQYEKSTNILKSSSSLSILVQNNIDEKKKIYNVAKDIYDNYKNI
jgi:hypothetical protein